MLTLFLIRPTSLPSLPVVLSPEMYTLLQRATFAILDQAGLPTSCGFFVTPCGVALTAAHDAEKWLRKKGKKHVVRASSYINEEFELEVLKRQVGKLDIAVLRLPGPVSAQPCLPLPATTFTAQQLSGAPVKLIHGSIAWNQESGASNFAEYNGSIITSNATKIHYNVGTFKGHSGAALLLRGEQVIGLHSMGFNDMPQEMSEQSPSTAADAERLDVPAVKQAVLQFMKAKTA